ncbi:MAG: hypothetical protein II007_04590 [Gammaproteobacteria bacterium]|nr:hypothetical protein [Gammaproteobacteria bacterium]
MARTNWKTLRPTSLRDSFELCARYARERKNLSVERIAEEMGMADHWTLYKWMSSGKMPAVMIPAFENVCGINYVTRWFAARQGRLLIDVPTGKAASPNDISDLQANAHQAIHLLIQFYAGNGEVEATAAAIHHAMAQFAWHQKNIEKTAQPELLLSEEDA